MKSSLKRVLSAVMLVCLVLSCIVPATYAEIRDTVVYDFDQADNTIYRKLADMSVALLGGDDLAAHVVANKSPCSLSMSERYDLATGQTWSLNWTYETASAGLRGITADTEHLPNFSYIKFIRDVGLRIFCGEGNWFAVRIKSPGSGEYALSLDYQKYSNYASPGTIAIHILPAEGEASLDSTTILDRCESIQAALDPDNRVGKVVTYDETGAANVGTPFVGNYTFEEGKEYIVVFEVYERSPFATSGYLCLNQLIMTPGAGTEEETETAKWIDPITVMKKAVPASDGGYMGALWEVNGHDYYFLPIEGGGMLVFDLDKFVAGEDPVVQTVNTGLYYPTHATVTQDGKVIVGGDGKRLFIFDTKTMTGFTTADFRKTAGLEGEGHNQGSHAGADGKIYFGTLYGGHLVQYDIAAKAYKDLGDMVCRDIQVMAGIINKNASDELVDDKGGVKSTAYHNGYVYANANSDRYDVIVKYDLNTGKVVGAIDVTSQMEGTGSPRSMTVLGDKYLIAGGAGGSGMVLIDLATFQLVTYEQFVGMFNGSTSRAKDAWENGMSIQATEVVGGKQYFTVNSTGLYSYDVATGKMAYVGSGSNGFRTGAKCSVTLDRNGDGVEETYLFTYAGGGQPRLYDPAVGKKISLNGLMKAEYGTGGSTINIGDSHDGVLYIGAWNNWNCVAFDTKTETILSRYVTGGQTDSQVSYVDENGDFHLVSGNYSACVVYEIDPLNKTGYDGDADSNIIKPLISKMKKYNQKRIHTVDAGDGYVFAGTIPGSYINGGGVGVYNSATGTEDFLHFVKTPVNGEKVVPAAFDELWDLSVKGIAYCDGRLYGATTRAGGSGSSYSTGTSAQIFVMDYENMAIEATLDLRDYLTLVDADGDGKEDPVDFVGGISVDPVVEGRIWGIVSDVLFCFTYDKTTKTFDVQEVLSLNISEYESSGGVGGKNRNVVFDYEHNQLFVSFYQSGMRCIKLSDWESATVVSHQRIMAATPKTYVLGADNNLYYESGTNLMVLPVNVTEEDWAVAGKVDALIGAIGTVTQEKAQAVTAAREAYDSLSLRDKALVQEFRTLQEAEAELFEFRIAAAAAEVSARAIGELADMLNAYNDLTALQQGYVKNYDTLIEAYETALIFNENPAANQVQEQIFDLVVTSRRDEASVVAAREAYEALPEDQKAMINTAKLIAAEEKLDGIKNTTGEVTEATAVAEAGSKYFASLQEAFAYQAQIGAEAVKLTCDVWEEKLILSGGAVLDLNGYALTADSVLTYSGSHIVDHSEDNTGILKIKDADGNMLSEENCQLPLYDSKVGGYRLFELTVEAATVTGKNGTDPKYWFKVRSADFESIYALALEDSGLLVKAKLAWNGGEADAIADVAFTQKWADAYQENPDVYIGVSAVNTEGLEGFALIPCMTANGVTIAGDDM